MKLFVLPTYGGDTDTQSKSTAKRTDNFILKILYCFNKFNIEFVKTFVFV